jgi:hypothetical protein
MITFREFLESELAGLPANRKSYAVSQEL